MLHKHKKLNLTILNLVFGVLITIVSLPVASTPLIGTPSILNDLPFPGDTGLPNRVAPTYVNNSSTVSFTGTWDTAAALEWQGTFTGSPDLPPGNFAITYSMNFSSLMNGVLPVNSYFGLGDLDGGSASNEVITLRAWDSTNTLITTPWLDEPTYQDGTNNPQLASMLPDFMWDSSAGIYTFAGSGETFAGNPSTSVIMLNNQEILILEVDDQTAYAGFGLSAPIFVPAPAPVPAPTTVCLIGLGLIGIFKMSKKSKLSIFPS